MENPRANEGLYPLLYARSKKKRGGVGFQFFEKLVLFKLIYRKINFEQTDLPLLQGCKR